MPRTPTTLDSFSALGEPKRRQLLECLASGERPVNDLVSRLGWPQPVLSKHLGVLKKVGLVNVRSAGRMRVYSLNAAKLKAVHDWVKTFERLWDYQLQSIKERAEAKVLNQTNIPNQQEQSPWQPPSPRKPSVP